MGTLTALVVNQLHDATSACSVVASGDGSSRPRHLICACGDNLSVYSEDQDGALQKTQQIRVFNRIEALVGFSYQDPHAHAHALALTSDLHVALLSVQRAPGAATAQLNRLVSKQLPPPPGHAAARRIDGVCCSRALSAHGHVQVALSTHHDTVHVVRWPAAGRELQTGALDLKQGALLDLRPGLSSPTDVQHTVAVHALELWEAEGHAAAARTSAAMMGVLYTLEGPGHSSVSLECLEIDWEDSAQPHLRPGPWACRHMHPTTTLIHHLPASRQPQSGNISASIAQGGLLAVSSRSLILITSPTQSYIVAGSSSDQRAQVDSGEGVRKVEVLQYALPGIPTCLTVLEHTDGAPSSSSATGGLLLAVADTMAGLYLMCVGGLHGPWMARVEVAGPLSSPSFMHHLPPRPGSSEGGGGLLFLGCKRGSSQVVALPQAALLSTCAPPAPGCPALKWTLSDAALIKSMAPVQDAVAVPDSQGAADPTLVVGCGVAPFGRLVRAKLGVALSPYFPDGPNVPEGVQLFPLGGEGGAAEGGHTHLAFSFDAAGRTDVLDVSGSSFSHTQLPGLQHEAPSLLLHTAPGGWLLQVNAHEARLLAPLPAASYVSSWSPPTASPMSLAAAAGSQVAVATAGELHLLQVHTHGSGAELKHVYSLPLGSQASALHVCEAGPSGQPCVVVAQWLANSVHILPVLSVSAQGLTLEGLTHTVLHLGNHTARSAALMPFGEGLAARWLLAVGTNSGAVMAWEVTKGEGSKWQLSGGHLVQISSVAAQLMVVRPTGAPAYLYAHSTSDAVLRMQPGQVLEPTRPLAEHLEVCRVHGSSHTRSVCHLSTSTMPDSVAWVTSGRQLMFGSLDTDVRMRWSTAYMGDTPHHVVHHASSRCLVVLSEGPTLGGGDSVGGVQWLRLVHQDSLQPVLAVRLAPAHRYTALHVASLPCTSTNSGGAAKEYIVVASYVLCGMDGTPLAGAEGPAGGSAQRPLTGGAHKAQGLLSFFEVVTEQSNGPDGLSNTEVRLSLLLHGVCAMPGVATALAVAAPKPAGAAVPQPLLLAGCHNGVHAFSVHVDDSRKEGQALADRLLTAAQQVPGLPPMPPAAVILEQMQARSSAADTLFPGSAAAAKPQGRSPAADVDEDDADDMIEEAMSHRCAEAQAAGGADTSSMHLDGQTNGAAGKEDAEEEEEGEGSDPAIILTRALRRDWSQHVTCREVVSAPTLSGFTVTSLSTSGAYVLAGDFLAGVTLFEMREIASKPSKSASSGPAAHPTVELSAVFVTREPIFAQASLLMGPDAAQTLVAAHPHGLLLLLRDGAAETAAVGIAQQAADALASRGRTSVRHVHEAQGMAAAWMATPPGAGRSAAAANNPATSGSKPTAPVPAELAAGAVIGAACCVQHPITKLLPMQLGLRMQPFEAVNSGPEATPWLRPPTTQPHTSIAPSSTAVTALCADGAVYSLHTGSGPAMAQLLELQHQQEQQEHKGPEPVDGHSLALGTHASAWQLKLPPSTEVARSMGEATQAHVPVCNAVDAMYVAANGVGRRAVASAIHGQQLA